MEVEMIVSGMIQNVNLKLVLLLHLNKILHNYVQIGYPLVQQMILINVKDISVKNMNLQLIQNVNQPCLIVLQMVLNVLKEDHVHKL